MTRILLLAFLLAVAVPAHAGLFGKSPEQSAADAERGQLPAVTIWVDATWGFRKAARPTTSAPRTRRSTRTATTWSACSPTSRTAICRGFSSPTRSAEDPFKGEGLGGDGVPPRTAKHHPHPLPLP